jgi:ABC-2 type transport system permease protein
MTIDTPTSTPAPAAPATGGRIRTPGALAALYRLVLRHQVTRGRLTLFAAITAVSTVLGWILSRAGSDRVEATVNVVSAFGFGLVIPVVALVLGSAALGTWVDDETLVYVWLRPVARWRVAVAAVAASLTVTLPVTVGALGIMAVLGSGADRDAVIGTVAGTALGGLAYVSVFVAVGLLLRRALLWGLVYVFIWEFFVSRAGSGAASLSINSYASSLLASYSGEEIRLADRAVGTSYVVLIGLGLVATAFTTWRLHRANVA